MTDKAIIISRDKDLDLWRAIRNLAWHYDKKIFDKLDENTFDVEIAQDIIKFKKEAER